MFNQVKQSLLVTDEAPIKLVQPAPANNSWIKKKEKVKTLTLTMEEIIYLEKNTQYKEDEIKEWFRIFKAECPNCQMKKEKVTEFYKLIMPNENAESFVEQMFQNFDNDNNGFLDFQEFLKLTDFAESGSVKDKLRWAFRIYDKDRSGYISVKEMMEMLGTIYSLEGFNKSEATERVELIFNLLDTDGDGEISLTEFIKGCLEDKEILSVLQ